MHLYMHNIIVTTILCTHEWCTCSGMEIRSPLMSVRTLLSSMTEFMDSIHRVSTGPSNTIHFSSGRSSVARRANTVYITQSEVNHTYMYVCTCNNHYWSTCQNAGWKYQWLTYVCSIHHPFVDLNVHRVFMAALVFTNQPRTLTALSLVQGSTKLYWMLGLRVKG